jgi:hypothetical protein
MRRGLPKREAVGFFDHAFVTRWPPHRARLIVTTKFGSPDGAGSYKRHARLRCLGVDRRTEPAPTKGLPGFGVWVWIAGRSRLLQKACPASVSRVGGGSVRRSADCGFVRRSADCGSVRRPADCGSAASGLIRRSFRHETRNRRCCTLGFHPFERRIACTASRYRTILHERAASLRARAFRP